MAVTFDTLKPDARIFLELNNNPHWWNRFKEDSSLYIEVRKDNQVNVYFEGGSIARIHYCSKHKKLQVFTHHKYLGLPAPSKSSLYIECSDFIDSCLNDVFIAEGKWSHEEVTALQVDCKNRLLQNAHDNGVLEKADKHGICHHGDGQADQFPVGKQRRLDVGSIHSRSPYTV